MDSIARQRLFEAMLLELGEKGYQETSVEDAQRAAGVSAAEFEAEFGGKDGCLFAAYDHLTGRVVERATTGCRDEEEWPERIRAGLTTVLEELAAQPAMARVMTRSFPGIRPSAYELYVDFLARFLPFVHEGRSYSGLAEELPGEVELLAVGAAEAIIFNEVDAGRAEELPKMMPEILFSLLVPFIGPDRAADEMRSASAAL